MTHYSQPQTIEQQILLATPLELTQILFDQGYALTIRIRKALADEDPRTRAALVSKCHSVLAELVLSLSPDKNEETERRRSVYGRLLHELTEAHCTCDEARFAQIQEAFRVMAANWRETTAILQNREPAHTSGVVETYEPTPASTDPYGNSGYGAQQQISREWSL